MAQIKGQAGVNLSQELANYLDANQGNLTSEQITTIINQYLTGGDKLGATGGSLSNGIYKRFGEFDQVNGKIEVVTTGLWSSDTGSMSTFFTSSTQTAASKNYYVNVYDKNPSSDTSATVQYAVAYGHKYASGSVDLTTSDTSTLASKATYAQYKSILLDAGDDKFTFYSSSAAGTHDSDDIYVINVARARYKEKMDAGNWSLILSGSTGTHTFIDDSGKKFSDTVGKSGRVFNVASGSLNLGTENEATVSSLQDSNGRGFGSFYPDQGVLIFNAGQFRDGGTGIGLDIRTGGPAGSVGSGSGTHNDNHFKFFSAISASGAAGSGFQARNEEDVTSTHYFVRVKNQEFNYSNNPTFTSGSNGTFRFSTFKDDPRVYVASVGMYNDANELLAVAKLSKPILKSFSKEILIKVKLDY